MIRRFLPMAAVASLTTGFLLLGAGTAVAAPGSHGGGSGKPSTASSSGNTGAGTGKPATTPSGNPPGLSKVDFGGGNGPTPGKPATPSAGNAGPKALPAIASQVASAAIAMDRPGTTGSPNSFGQAVAASVAAKGRQAGAVASVSGDVAVAVAQGASANVTVAVAAAGVEVSVAFGVSTSIPVSGSRNNDPAPSRPFTGRDAVAPVIPAPRPDPSAPPAGGAGPRTNGTQTATTTAPVAAAISPSRPQSTTTADTGDSSAAAGANGSWLGRTVSRVVDEVREALREVTLKELALAALPGLAGILFFFASGIGIGHRQARFGFAIESTGAIRFATSGPLGVVRRNGFVAARARETRPRPRTLAQFDRAA